MQLRSPFRKALIGSKFDHRSLQKAVNTNHYISRFYIFYQALILALSFLSIAVTSMSLWEALDMAMSDNLSTIYAGVIIILPIIFFVFICFKYESNTQLFWAFILRLIFKTEIPLNSSVLPYYNLVLHWDMSCKSNKVWFIQLLWYQWLLQLLLVLVLVQWI